MILKILSVIIPAYNSEAYLDKCITSMIVPEVMNELEIIVVNDGSQDSTADIAAAYCRKYPQTLRLICQENKGHGGALNAGCAAAQGKYLKVIDADDWVNTEVFPEFIQLLKQCNSDVVLTHYHTIDITTGEKKSWKSYPASFGSEYDFQDIMSDWRSYDRCLTFHGITYKSEFYHKYGIALTEHVFYEDHEFATYPCCYAESITPLDLFVYEYRIGDVNQSVSYSNQCKRIGHTETVLQKMLDQYVGLPETMGKQYAAMKIQGLVLSYLTTALLIYPDRTQGREIARKQIDRCQKQAPRVAALAWKKYCVFVAMNRLHISIDVWNRILHSTLYNRIRKNHTFD